ncbi:MAG: hypothetical protein ABF242_10780 [Flavobacteriales bacterium]
MNKIGKGSLFAILITLVIHIAMLLYFNVSTLKTTEVFIPNEVLLELDFKTPEEIEEIINPEPEIAQNNQSIKDLMSDIQDIRNQSYEDFSESEMDNEILKSIEAENKKSVEELRDNGIKGFDKSEFDSEPDKKEVDKDKNTDKKNNNFAGKVTKECNIPGRECSTGTPSYQCAGGGKVYIDITVDKIGRVKSAKVNTSKSSTNSDCILNTALRFAKTTTKASSDLSGNNSQAGYIIYNFISQ